MNRNLPRVLSNAVERNGRGLIFFVPFSSHTEYSSPLPTQAVAVSRLVFVCIRMLFRRSESRCAGASPGADAR